MEGQSQMGFIWKAFENSFDKIGIFMIVFYYAVFSFISTLIREIIKDIEDVNGDYQMKMYTLPIALGIKEDSEYCYSSFSITSSSSDRGTYWAH